MQNKKVSEEEIIAFRKQNEQDSKQNAEQDKKDDFVLREFGNVLEKDEQVLYVLKPNKSVYILSNFLKALIPILFFAFMFVLVMFIPNDMTEASKIEFLIPFYIIAGLVFLTLSYGVIVCFRYVKISCYVFTNKRILFKGGFNRVEYKAYDYNSIVEAELKKGIADKIINKNTETLNIRCKDDYNKLPTFSVNNVENLREIYENIKPMLKNLE